MSVDREIFTNSDNQKFRDWLKLNLQGLTWEGKFSAEFEDFWTIFFGGNNSLSELMTRFRFAITKVRVGPLASWFTWLRDRFLCYHFIYKGYSVFDLAAESGCSENELALIFRDFLIERFPHLDEQISRFFHIGNVTSENLFITFKEVEKEIGIHGNFSGSYEEEMMNSLEVTLYEEWMRFYELLKHEVEKNSLDLSRIDKKETLAFQVRFLKELVVLSLLGMLAIFGVHKMSAWYEQSLAEKITIFQPEFSWLDKTLEFKSRTIVEQPKVGLGEREFDELEKQEKKSPFDDTVESSRVGPESEVTLASLDALPKGFSGVGFEHSEYEEESRTSYRDSLRGSKKAFRVMMKTSDATISKDKLNELIKRYRVEQVDRVKPGTHVPGGIYYNLYVPVETLQDFLKRVTEIGDSILYESRTKGRNPPGKSRVFIWIKSI